MTDLPRVLIGQRGNAMGLWVSKPNRNVLTASDDDMLLSPTSPNFAFLIKGQRSLFSVTDDILVPFGHTLSNIPIVWAQTLRGGVNLIPPMQINSPLNTSSGRPGRFIITPTASSLRIKNLKPIVYTLQYMVLHNRLEI